MKSLVISKIEELQEINRKAAATKRGATIEHRAHVDKLIAGNKSKMDKLAFNYNASTGMFGELAANQAKEFLKELLK